MLASLSLTLSYDTHLNFNTGSLLHGVLMQLISPRYAEKLHQNSNGEGVRPYSQYVYYDTIKQNFVWKIATLTEEAYTEIMKPLQSESFDSINIEHYKTAIKIMNKELSPIASYNQLAGQCFSNVQEQRRFNLKFITPSSFKQADNYLIFPQVDLLYKSLLTRWEAFSAEITLNDVATYEHLIKNTKIVGYTLRSTRFNLEHIKINAFLGTIGLYVSGSEVLLNIVNLLFKFSHYTGVGVKTALGMGGVSYE